MNNLLDDCTILIDGQPDDEWRPPPEPTREELQVEWDALSSDEQDEIWNDFYSDRRYADEPVVGYWYPLLIPLSRQST